MVSFPPPSSGGVHLAQMLRLIERGEVPSDPYNADFIHRRIEIMRRAYQDRARHLGDPDFYPVPVEGLLSAAHLDALASTITDRATPSDQLNNPQPEGAKPAKPAAPTESESTTHLSVVDRFGNAVSMTFTINYGFGAAVIPPGTGVLLNDEMDDFSIAPGTPNAYGLVGGEAAIEPGKHPVVHDTDAGARSDQRLKLVIGNFGGSTIITTVLQILLHVVDRDDARSSDRQPRLHHRWLPDCVLVDRADQLRRPPAPSAKGHCVKARLSIGNAHGCWRSRRTVLGRRSARRGGGGCADPSER